MIVFDIETGPRPDDELRQVATPFDPSRVNVPTGEFDDGLGERIRNKLGIPAEFDPSSVKLGRMTDQAKIDDKIAAARAEHAQQLAEIARRVDNERAEFEQAKANGPQIIAQAEQEHWAAIRSKAALSPVTGRVLAIGYWSAKAGCKITGVDEPADEAHVLGKFWHQYGTCRSASRSMVGFNIHGFDLPFMVKRSWLLGVDVPATLFDPSGRYFDRVFVDLMARWKCGNYSESIKLSAMARFFGCGDKPDGIHGGDFARLWVEDRPTAVAYLENDLQMTAGCAARMGYV